ncbi:MAG: hypothetical protein KJP18_08870 [Gemmatimonadetes bacterium]|nr:hypothetical protein [Gemmatimonadota bacterium]NNK62362.1 hypothetical protein [Gemmatimonadota bacterium]
MRDVRRLLLAAGVVPLCFGAAAVVPIEAQPLRPPPAVDVSTRDPFGNEVVDEIFFAGRVAEAAQRLDIRLERDSADVEALWRGARTSLVAGILEPDPDLAEAWFKRAGALGEAAVTLRADDPEVLYWAAASLGREALQHGPRTSTRLIQRMWDLTHRILEIEPEHAGAHNTLGKLNYEVMSLSGFERFVGRLLFRIDPLREATWDAAVAHHRRAFAADPETVLFGRDLGETLLATGRDAEAREVWSKTLALPSVFPVDERFKHEIREMMGVDDSGGR